MLVIFYDLALAEKLGYTELRGIRRLVSRLLERKTIKPEQVRVTVTRLSNGKDSTEYLLSEKAALKVITKSETETADRITDEVIDVFMAYRSGSLPSSQPLNPANMSRLQLLEMAMQAEQERLALEHKVEEMQPKVEALDRIATAEGSVCITDAAKLLQINPKKLFAFLFEHDWIFKRTSSSSWTGYQDRLKQGLIEHKIELIQRTDGSEKTITQARITPKGLARLSMMLRSTELA